MSGLKTWWRRRKETRPLCPQEESKEEEGISFEHRILCDWDHNPPPSIDPHSPKSPRKLFLFQLVRTCEEGCAPKMTDILGSIRTDGFIQIPLRTAAESSTLLSTCGGGDDHGIKDEDLTVLVSPRKFTQACSRFEQLASPSLCICNADSIFA